MSNFDYGRYYRRYHADTPEHIRWQVEFNRRILAPHLPDMRAKPALDIGCGMGFALQFLSEAGFCCAEGIDIDDTQVKSSQARGLNVKQVDDAVAFTSLRNEYYGLILAMDVIEHMPQAEQLSMARAIYSALVPGGRFICSVPNANSVLAERWRYNDFTHHSSFTEVSLDFLLYHAGFRQIQISGYEFALPPNQQGIHRKGFKRFRHYLKYQVRAHVMWLLLRLVRGWRRIQMISELDVEQGSRVPLSLNLLGVATK